MQKTIMVLHKHQKTQNTVLRFKLATVMHSNFLHKTTNICN